MKILNTLLIAFLIFNSYGKNSLMDDANSMLDFVREERKEQLKNYLNYLNLKSIEISNDGYMKKFFKVKNLYYKEMKKTTPPEKFKNIIEKSKKTIQECYLLKYLVFYDILFINTEGDIFYTIRKQADYHQNLFSGFMGKTKLAQRLKTTPSESFIDFTLYEISEEPSAFLVRPVHDGSVLVGWFVLQCAINKINNMFSQDKELGITGEVFLVNKEQYMLTDSRFNSESTILKQHLSQENIHSKFLEKKGNKLVVDYRGYKALTSFEVFPVLGNEWLLIAKIDEDEIITDFYKTKPYYVNDHFYRKLFQNRSGFFNFDKNSFNKKRMIEVDIDEFRKASPQEILYTHGVSTCTAITISLPGKFSYMAHISSYDKAYGGTQTDLLSNILKRIERFDIHSYEKRDLQIVIVAPHTESIKNIINFFLEHSLFLSQIRFLHNNEVRYADIYHNCKENQTLVEWVPFNKTGNIKNLFQDSKDTETISEIFLKTITN